jgi:hypothetical protein
MLHALEPFGSQIKIGGRRVGIWEPGMLVDRVHQMGTVGVLLPAVGHAARLKRRSEDRQAVIVRD